MALFITMCICSSSHIIGVGLFMVLNIVLNNISVISWRSVLLMDENGKTTDLPQVTDNLYNVVTSTP